MTIKLETNSLLNTFQVSCFDQLEQGMQVLAPSMIDYHLDDLAANISEPAYINKSSIQQTIYLGEYSLYLDYNDSIYLEFTQKDDSYDTESLW